MVGEAGYQYKGVNKLEDMAYDKQLIRIMVGVTGALCNMY